MNNSLFVLHPASRWVKEGYVKPDQIVRAQLDLKYSNGLFAESYESCTNFNRSQISKILESDYNLKQMTDKAALKAGLALDILTAVPPAEASIYISK